MEYRCVATSVEGFVQQLAVAYIAHGYWYYVLGRIPEHKDPTRVDIKLLSRYEIAASKWVRYRRKQQGLANVHYLRIDRTFVLIATKGRHRFFDDESGNIRDIRRVPFKHNGYAISYRNGHASVRIDRDTYAGLKACFTDMATKRSSNRLSVDLRSIPFVPYAPVRRQLLNLHRAVNRLRKQSGLEPIPVESLRLSRRIVRPFAIESERATGQNRTTRMRR